MRKAMTRAAYRAAFLTIRTWRIVTGARGRGGMVLIWVGDEILLVKPSYAPYYTLPGGRANRGEALIDAAVRELQEETGILMSRDQVRAVDHPFFRMLLDTDVLGLYETKLLSRPSVQIDGVEIEDYRFVSVEEALQLKLYNKLWRYLSDLRHCPD